MAHIYYTRASIPTINNAKVVHYARPDAPVYFN